MSLHKTCRIMTFIFFTIACFLFGYLIFASKTFGNVSVEQILFHLVTPLKQADIRLFYKGFGYAVFLPILGIILLSKPSILLPKKYKIYSIAKAYENKTKLQFFLACLILSISSFTIVKSLKISDYLRNIKNPSSLYETHFVTAEKAGISFTKEKKNIVIIYLESMENTYKNQSVFKDNVLPNLTRFSSEGLSFQGFKQLNGTQWSMAGIFSGLCGAPLKVPMKGVRLDLFKSFMPNIVCVPEILQQNGYNNYFLLGSSASFSGVDNFLNQHGFTQFWGKDELETELGEFTEEMRGTGWGLNDHELFKVAQNKLTQISQKNEPFLFGMATIDTHFPNGYLNKKTCETKYNNFLDVVTCSDKEIGNFVDWIKKQPFAKNTVIILVGDHITMGNDVFDQIVKNPQREIINIFIEPTGKRNIAENRKFSTMDFAPTILSLAGADIQTNSFGLGRNLLTAKPTLLEEMGDDFVKELDRFSRYYQTFFSKEFQ